MPGKVMVIEDDEVVSRSIARRLIAGGFSVISAYDAIQAIPRARAELPDLIIVDDWLPGGTGIQLVGRMINVPALSNIPMILMLSSADVADDAINTGARDTVLKPVDLDDLYGRVVAVLGGAPVAAPVMPVPVAPPPAPSWDSMPVVPPVGAPAVPLPGGDNAVASGSPSAGAPTFGAPVVAASAPAANSVAENLPLLMTLDPAELERFSHLAAAVLGASIGFVAVPGDAGPTTIGHWMRDAPTSTPWESPLTRVLARLTIQMEEVFPVNDVRKHPLTRANAAVGEHGVEAYLGVPIVDGGEIIGVIGAVDAEARLFTADHSAAIATLAGLLLEHARLRARR